ncbi:MAG: hypothetical protein Aurels2KO_12560 [Aureliella sp.]
MNTPAKQSLFASTDLARLIVNASPAGMLIVDSAGQIVLVNPQARQWFGYSEEELLGQRIEILIPSDLRHNHKQLREGYAQQPRSRSMAAGRDLFGLRKDGSKFPVDISLHPIEAGEERMVLANIVDATNRHQAERDRAARRSMERLALLGQLAGGVAHEIRTPLCIIGNDAYFLETLADKLTPEARDCIEEIKTAVDKANGIVSELLDFTRDTTSNLQKANLLDVIAPSIRLAGIPDGVSIQESLADQSVDVAIDSDQIERILVNLLRNACQAMDDSGKIHIEISCEVDKAILRVSDDGPGIPVDHLDRVFEPLFTTKAKGIGLGLAIARRYAQQNNGHLELLESSTSGTVFQLSLPLTIGDN